MNTAQISRPDWRETLSVQIPISGFATVVVAALSFFSPLVASHFTEVKISVHLIDPDSITLEVDGDYDDLMNSVHTFPYVDFKKQSFLLYQERIESYLRSKLPTRVDWGNPLDLKVIQWKPGGKGRADGFDSSSILASRHVITLGGRLPKKRQYLRIDLNLWAEFDGQMEVESNAGAEISLLHNGIFLRRKWFRLETTAKLPISRDSLSALEPKGRSVSPQKPNQAR